MVDSGHQPSEAVAMSSEVEPVLSPARWAAELNRDDDPMSPDRETGIAEGRAGLFEGGLYVGYDSGFTAQPVDNLPAVIALANHCLPDNHPHKITRAMVDALRELAGPRRVAGARIAVWLTRPDEYVLDPSQLHEIADVLESYLPPEAT